MTLKYSGNALFSQESGKFLSKLCWHVIYIRFAAVLPASMIKAHYLSVFIPFIVRLLGCHSNSAATGPVVE